MKQQLEQIKTAALEAIAAAQNSADCENVRVKYLGKKGELTAILKSMGGLSPEERPIMGQLVNTAKAEVDAALSAKVTEMQAAADMDLTPYAGKRLKCWSYRILNSGNAEETIAHLYVWQNTIVGGDITESVMNGKSTALVARG